MIKIRSLAIILGLLTLSARAEAAVLEFDFSGVSVNPLNTYGTNPLGYTATVSFTLDSSDFTNGSPFIFTQGMSTTGITLTDIYTSALTSFSASLTTPLGNRQFSLSDVRTGCPQAALCVLVFSTYPSGQIVFQTGFDGFTNSANPLGYVNPYTNALYFNAFNGGAGVHVDYSGTWTTPQIGGVAAPLSDLGTGLPSLLLVGGLILWGRRRQLRKH